MFRDGINIRYHQDKDALPAKYQLLIEFDDDSYITVTVAMYGFMGLHQKDNVDNKYYQIELSGLSPLSERLNRHHFNTLITDDTKKLSAKAFIATNQRILGIGNGVTQDILFNAKINPKTKMRDLDDDSIESLYNSIKNTLSKMISENARDTEKNIFDKYGDYKTILGKNTVGKPCPVCHEIIKKEQYLGGSIYFCPSCQNKKVQIY